MLIGTPYKFSIFIQILGEFELSNSSSITGMLFIGISDYGKIFPDQLVKVNLHQEVFQLKEKLMNIPMNNELYDMNGENIVQTLQRSDKYKKDSRYHIFNMSCDNIQYHVFAVSDSYNTKLFGVKATGRFDKTKNEVTFDDANLEISEHTINNGVLLEMIEQLDIELVIKEHQERIKKFSR